MSAVSAVEASWSRDYVTFMRCDAGDGWLTEVERQLGTWLREKDFDVDLRVDGDHALATSRLAVRRLEQGGVSDLRVTLIEDGGADDVWTTELLAHDEPGEQDWIYLAVRNSAGRFVAVPRIARWLMEVLPLGDGILEFTPRPQLFRADDVPRLHSLLADDGRHGLVFVAGTDQDSGIPIKPFADLVEQVTGQVYGLAQVIVLDPAATAQFAERVGPGFAARPWTIHTYQPGVEFDSEVDAQRHRTLGTNRLANQSPARSRFFFGDVARNHAAERELPAAVRQVRRRFERSENRRVVEVVPEPVVETAPVVEPSQAGDDHRIGLVQRILGLAEVTESALRDLAGRLTQGLRQREVFEQRIGTLQSRVEALEDENAQVREALLDEQFSHEVTALDIEKRDARVRWLEQRLKDKGDYEAEYTPVPDDFVEHYPDTFSELVERIADIDGVEFTGDEDDVALVSARDTNGAALRTAWESLLSLRDYVRAKQAGDCTQGLEGYLKNTPPTYRSVPPGKFAQSETGTTMSAWGNERLFPVPPEVDPSGEVANEGALQARPPRHGQPAHARLRRPPDAAGGLHRLPRPPPDQHPVLTSRGDGHGLPDTPTQARGPHP